MSDNEKSIFRKSSLERVSSPEQLNEYVKITNPSLIVILGTVLVILITGIFMAVYGKVPEYISLTGVITSSKYDTSENVYCYVPISTARQLQKGMDVQISPEYAAREKYGYIKGEVLDVGSEIITDEYISETFENPLILSPILSSSEAPKNLIQVKLSIGDWSSEKGEGMDIIEGTICSISAIVGEQRAFDLIFNG